MWFGGGTEGGRTMTQRGRRWPSLLPLAVTCLLVLEGDDSDFYHREMNSDCSPTGFSCVGPWRVPIQTQWHFPRCHAPTHPLERTNSRDHSPRRVLIGPPPPCRLPPMKKTHQTLLSFYRSLEIRLLTVSSLRSTASLSHLRTMLPESSSCLQPAQRPNHAT